MDERDDRTIRRVGDSIPTDKAEEAGPSDKVMEQLLGLFKESIEETNADMRYFLQQLAESNAQAEALAEHLKELVEQAAEQQDDTSSSPISRVTDRVGRKPELVHPQDYPTIQEFTVFPGAPPADATYYSISPADVFPEWGAREDVPWHSQGVRTKFGWGEYGGYMITGVHLPHGARIWGWRAYGQHDVNVNHPTTMTVRLIESDLSLEPDYAREIGQSQTASFQPGGSAEHKVIYQDNLDHSVDNSKCAYTFKVGFSGDGPGRCWFLGATIIYLPPAP